MTTLPLQSSLAVSALGTYLTSGVLEIPEGANTYFVASQVGFKDFKAVLKTKVEERINAIVNRLNATKQDVPQPDLAGEREAYEKEVMQTTLCEMACPVCNYLPADHESPKRAVHFQCQLHHGKSSV